MARTTKQLSGGGKDKFLRGLIAAETAIPADVAGRLGDSLCDAIADIRVRRDAWHPEPHAAVAPGEEQRAPKSAPARSQRPADATAPFDPFVFSALAVLTKQGQPALAAKLDTLASAEQLLALAKAQHLAVDTGLSDLGALRAAIIAATVSRLAERRAAAS